MKKQAEREAALADEVRSLKAQLDAAKEAGAVRQAQAERATAEAMGGEVGGLEFALKIKAANQAIVVRCAAEHSAIHRCWRVWASVASLLLREAAVCRESALPPDQLDRGSVERRAMDGVDGGHGKNGVDHGRRNMLWECQPVRLAELGEERACVGRGAERRVASNEGVEHHPQRPHVRSVALKGG